MLRDTDKDGTPDKTDLDDDGDGINDTEEAPGESKKVTKLTATATNPTEKATEGQPYTSGETAVVTKNKPNAVISSTETKGLKVNAEGKVEGTPRDLTWNGNDEEQTVTIPVTVSHTGDEDVTLNVEVTVLRDTDKTLLTAGRINPTNPAVDGQPYTSNEKVINPNKPDTTITPTPTNGLTIDGTSGKVTGTPSGLTWNGDDTEQTVNIPVVITKGNETINETIPVVVHRSSRNGQPEIQEEISEYTKPIGTTGVDENGNLLEPPVVDIPEYTEPIGTTGVDENGNLITPPSHLESQKLKVVITKWTDEQGNDLKQPDAKAPSVPGEANEAFEPGEIDGYVFVRTELKGNVVTHIFRKVSSAETSGGNKPQSTPEVPTDNTEHKPVVITPNEQTTETENPTVKPKASQNILPNTGTADGLGIFSKAVASILAGLGLFLPVKKEDENEEETQNN